MTEQRCECVIVNSRGLHARASAKFVNVVSQLPDGVSVSVAKDDNSAAGGSILGLMMLGAAKGDTIELRVSGDETGAVMEELSTMIQNGFDED